MTRKTYTQEEKDWVTNLSNEGYTIADVMKITGFPRSPISRLFAKAGHKSWNKDTHEEIVRKMDIVKDVYLSNDNYRCSDVAKITGIELKKVERYVCEMGIGHEKGIKTSIQNVDYFDNIDTQEKAYFLGWLMADGNVSIYNGQYSIKIHIKKDDKYLIDQFQVAIGSHYPINERDSYTRGVLCHSIYISATSRHMVESLMKYGIVPRKTGTERMPDIPEELKRHFLRGYFDGDGHAIHADGSIQYNFGFTAPRAMCQDIIDFVGQPTAIVQRIGVCQMAYGKKKGRILYNLMYKDATIKLDRKFTIMYKVYGDPEVTNEPQMALAL